MPLFVRIVELLFSRLQMVASVIIVRYVFGLGMLTLFLEIGCQLVEV